MKINIVEEKNDNCTVVNFVLLCFIERGWRCSLGEYSGECNLDVSDSPGGPVLPNFSSNLVSNKFRRSGGMNI